MAKREYNLTTERWGVFEHSAQDSFIENAMSSRNALVSDITHIGVGTPLILYTYVGCELSYEIIYDRVTGRTGETGTYHGTYSPVQYLVGAVPIETNYSWIGNATRTVGDALWDQDLRYWNDQWRLYQYAKDQNLFSPSGRTTPEFEPYVYVIAFTGERYIQYPGLGSIQPTEYIVRYRADFPISLRNVRTAVAPVRHIHYLQIPLQIVGFATPNNGPRYPVMGTTVYSLQSAIQYIVGDMDNIQPHFLDPQDIRNFRPLREYYTDSTAGNVLFRQVTLNGVTKTIWEAMGDNLAAQTPDPHLELLRGSRPPNWLGSMAGVLDALVP